MKILSWNVNGIRAVQKKGALEWLWLEQPDIFCLQETKALPEQLTKDLTEPKGYFAYYNYPKVKKGYSGVALFSKIEPMHVFYGMKEGERDEEGRIVGAEYKDFFLINIYFPNGGGRPERLAYKLAFYDEFLAFIEKLKKKKPVIFCGDVNTAHEAVDLARPDANKENTGFLPVERAWIDTVIEHGYVDTFRNANPNAVGAYSYWDMKTFARERNVGWRIDYFFVSQNILSKVKKAYIKKEVFGSDHCPVVIEMS